MRKSVGFARPSGLTAKQKCFEVLWHCGASAEQQNNAKRCEVTAQTNDRRCEAKPSNQASAGALHCSSRSKAKQLSVLRTDNRDAKQNNAQHCGVKQSKCERSALTFAELGSKESNPE